jgi:hypothetical protein
MEEKEWHDFNKPLGSSNTYLSTLNSRASIMYLDCVHGPDPESTKNSHEKQAQKTQVTTHSVWIEVIMYISTLCIVLSIFMYLFQEKSLNWCPWGQLAHTKQSPPCVHPRDHQSNKYWIKKLWRHGNEIILFQMYLKQHYSAYRVSCLLSSGLFPGWGFGNLSHSPPVVRNCPNTAIKCEKTPALYVRLQWHNKWSNIKLSQSAPEM